MVRVKLPHCQLGNNWLTPERNGATSWHGLEAQIFKSFRIPNYELIHNDALPAQNWSTVGIQAVYNGLVDMDTQIYGTVKQTKVILDEMPQFFVD